MRGARAGVIVLILGLLLAAPGEAQIVTGALRGTVTDTTGAVLPGATAELSGPALIGGPKVAVTDERGQFRFPALSPGLYIITVSMQSFQTQRREGIRVEVGSQFDVNFSLAVAKVSESVTVTGDSPIVDTSRSAMTTTVSRELLSATPIVRFTFFDLAYMTPGVSTMRFDNTASRASAFGANVNENMYQLDGADLTAPQTGAAWPWPSTDIIQELQVIGLGAPAEYGNYQGAVFNVITRSGSNAFKADVNFYWQPHSLAGQNATIDGIPYNRDRYYDFTANVGGPIKKDKLWFFGGTQYRQDWYSEPGIDPTLPQKSNDWREFGKVTWQATKNNKITGFLEWDGFKLPRPVTVSQPFETTGAEAGNNPVPNISWTSVINDKTFFEVRYAGFYGVDKWVPNSGDFNTPGHVDTATDVYSVNSMSWYDGKVWKSQVSGKISRYIPEAAGSHDIRAGLQFTRGGIDEIYAFSGGMAYYDYGGQYDTVVVQTPNHGEGGVSTNIGAFVDDTWNVSSHVSLTLGLRYDHSIGSLPDYPVLDSNAQPTGEMVKNPGTVVTWNNVSPRIGANFRFDSAGKTIGRAHYGRFYSILQTRIYNQLNRAVTPATTYQLDPITGERLYVLSVTDPAAGIPELQSDLKAPYTDQFSVGLDHEILGNLSIGGSFIYKKGHNLIGRIRPYALYTTKSWSYTDRNGQSRTIDVFSQDNNDAVGNTVRVENNPRFYQDYKALVVQANKRMSNRWMMLASLTVSKSTGMNAGSDRTDPYSNQESNTRNFGRDPNDYTNADGVLIGDRPYMFKMQGAYQLPYDIQLSGDWQVLSGKPIFTQVRTPSSVTQQGRRSIFDVPRSEEVIRAPTVNVLDLRVEKEFVLGRGVKANLAFAVFNLLNNGAFYSVASTTIPTSTTPPAYLQGVTFVPPRRAQFVFRFLY
jgi:Carboxypeptidase regulatory-like domain/TonB dependent receptor-like, beta-barrel